MDKTSTQLNLIQFIYNEFGKADNAFWMERINTDADCNEEYDQIMTVVNDLSSLNAQPSKQAIENIIAYSAATC